jgi:type I restriction enzyme, S subunit
MITTAFLDSEEIPLPKTWRMERIADAYRFTRKPKEIRYGDFTVIPFVPMSLIPDGGATTPSFKQKPPQEISSGTYFEKGDLLLPKITPSFENGKQAIASNLPAPFGIATTEVIPIQSIDGSSDIHFLFYYLLKNDVRKAIAAKMEGSTGRQRVPEHVVREWLMPLPPIDEQEKIAAVLWKIQKAVEIEDAIVRNARDLKKSLLRRLFTHGLRGEPLKETEIGPLPESWQLVTIADVTTLLYRYPTYYNIDYVSEGVPEVRGELLRDNGVINDDPSALRFVSEQTAARFPRVRLSRGDIVMSVRGTMGKIGIVGPSLEGAVITANLIRLKTNQSLIDSDFLRWALLSEGFQTRLDAASSKTTIHTIPAPDLKRLQIPLPDIDEQREIADIVQAVDRKIDIHESKKRSLQDLFKTTLHKLMTAQIRVNDLDIDMSEATK